jgi:hypothetical protein
MDFNNMDFNIGDVIYKKKFYGDKLLPDKRNSYIIMYLYTVSYPGCNNLLFATLDNNKEFEIMDGNHIYAERFDPGIFCCCYI